MQRSTCQKPDRWAHGTGVPLWPVCQSTTSGCKGGFLFREHCAWPQEGIQRSLSINTLEVGGDGERHTVPSTRAVTPVSRARQQGCPTAWLKCSCAATQAALVPTDVCLPKETDTISQPYNNFLQQKNNTSRDQKHTKISALSF